MSELTLRNRQRARCVNLPLLRRVARALLTGRLRVENYELGVCLVAAPQMTRLNERFLNHVGSTDVITFDYSGKVGRASCLSSKMSVKRQDRQDARPTLHGEIFICIDDAVAQARRFRTTWQSELVRYLVHGVLHLRGYDDRQPKFRRAMKREEDRLVGELARLFPLSKLARKPTVRP